MYFAICDDREKESGYIADLIAAYAAARKVDIRLRCFDCAEEMLRLAETERFTHYILDIIMPGMNGIDAAKEIRRFDSEAMLVFLTSSNEFACQSYRVKAADYLLKPVDEKLFFDMMDEMRARAQDAQDCFSIQNGRSVIRVSFDALSYLEINQKQLYFHLADGHVHQIHGTMAEYEGELLNRKEFVKIHRSYIVNMNRISMLSPDGCITLSGKNLPVSRLLYNQVHKRYIEHLFGNREA